MVRIIFNSSNLRAIFNSIKNYGTKSDFFFFFFERSDLCFKRTYCVIKVNLAFKISFFFFFFFFFFS